MTNIWTSAGLTPREREVAERLCRGETREEISTALVISPRTTDTHRLKVLSKCGVGNSVQLVLHALRAGWRPDTQLHFKEEEENGKENEG